MYRTSSWNRLPDDDYIHGPPPMASTTLRMAAFQANEPPEPPYDAEPDQARKEKSRSKFAENAVHVIPFVLLLCAAVLWFFSTPQPYRKPFGYPRKTKPLLG